MLRRTFLRAAAAASALGVGSRTGFGSRLTHVQDEQRFDPWIEIDTGALASNVATVGQLSGGRPILAVTKNNAYGLGLAGTAQELERHDGIAGFAVIKAEAAALLRDRAIRKPVLLMGLATGRTARELAARDIQLSLYNDEGVEAAVAAAASLGRPVDVQLYLDTGMGRMGHSFRQALPWIASVAENPSLRVRGTYMAFTEESDFDPEQLRRFVKLMAEVRRLGIEPGTLHAASSNGVFHLPDAHLDAVRPGIALYGSYPSRPDEERAKATLRSAFALKARVVRVTRLEKGDTVSYGRRYTASKPTWIATLPVGHVDGYPRKAVEGARVLLGGRLCPVIGAVSASHTIVEIGDEPAVAVGDVATLLGPEPSAIQPNEAARAAGVSVYDLLMHLHPSLPRTFLGV